MTNKFSLRQFRRKYGTHLQCLEAIKAMRFPDNTECPKCKQPTIFYQVADRTAYACKWCGWHVYPLAGTVFEKSTTSLDLWFFAMYLMVQTRAGISAKQLERMLGVTYKTAWRMFKQIRALMADTDGTSLDGVVEVDETFVGGKATNRRTKYLDGHKEKEIVMGMLKRGGKAYFKHIPNTGKWTLLRQIQENVSPKTTIYSDEYGGYYHLPKFGYRHESVNHLLEMVKGEVHTQNIENFWSHLKRGITGVYRLVSKKYLQAYVDEYGWRYNNRLAGGGMFDLLLRQVVEVRIVKTV